MPSTRRLSAWLTALVILAAALAPAVSQWLASAHRGAGNWVEVCSTAGSKWVFLGETSRQAGQAVKLTPKTTPGDQGPADLHTEHCPFCVLQAHAVGLPPAAITPLVAVNLGADALPALFLHAPHTLFAWSPSLARAPPSLS